MRGMLVYDKSLSPIVLIQPKSQVNIGSHISLYQTHSNHLKEGETLNIVDDD